MVRATTLKKNAKARAASMSSDQDDGIVATIILPPGNEHVLEGLKKVMAGSIMLDRRPEPERPQKKENAVNPFNILNAVLHYAESPAAPTMNDLYQHLHKDGMVKKFFEVF